MCVLCVWVCVWVGGCVCVNFISARSSPFPPSLPPNSHHKLDEADGLTIVFGALGLFMCASVHCSALDGTFAGIDASIAAIRQGKHVEVQQQLQSLKASLRWRLTHADVEYHARVDAANDTYEAMRQRLLERYKARKEEARQALVQRAQERLEQAKVWGTTANSQRERG